jgi:hypothetical protein
VRPLPRATPRYDERDQLELRREIERVITAIEPTTGKYTPVLTSSGGGQTVTYSTQKGHWWRQGDLVWFSAEIVLATLAGGSGDIRVSLPIRPESNQSAPVAAALFNHGATFTGAPNVRVDASIPAVVVKEWTGGTAAQAWTKLGATGAIRLSGSYLAGT